MKDQLEQLMNIFPEVVWDRWGGSENTFQVFGWIKIQDKSDFVLMQTRDGEVTNLVTSSYRYSEEFSKRLGHEHLPCKRVESYFFNVNSIKL